MGDANDDPSELNEEKCVLCLGGEMPWLALPYEKRAEKDALSKAFGVSGIPSFIIINPDGSVVTTDGRSKVTADPKGETFPAGWLPQPFTDANDDPSELNEEKCVLCLGGETSMCEAVKAVAEEYYAKAGKDVSAMPLRFFTAPKGDVGDQIYALTKQEGNKLILLDIQSDGAFYVCEAESPDAAGVRSFILDVLAEKVERKQLEK